MTEFEYWSALKFIYDRVKYIETLMEKALAPENEVFIRPDFHRLFAVLEVNGTPYIERLPLNFSNWQPEQSSRHMVGVKARLLEKAGLKQSKRTN